MTTTYKATVTRDGALWAIELPGVSFGYTQARRLSEVEYMTRDLIATMYDVPADSFDVTIEWPEDIAALVDSVRCLRQEARQLQRRSEEATRDAVYALRDHGLSIRDAAAVLRVSPSRVGQIVQEETTAV